MHTARYTDIMKPSHYDFFDPFRVLDTLYSSVRSDTTRESFYRTERSEDSLSLSIDLPGLKAKDLSVHIEDRDLKIFGKIRNEDFKYTYKIPKPYDTETVKADLEDGVLTLTFKKSDESSTRVVEVTVK